jgi:hypothetical protein
MNLKNISRIPVTEKEYKKLDKLVEKISDLGNNLIEIGEELEDIAGTLQWTIIKPI